MPVRKGQLSLEVCAKAKLQRYGVLRAPGRRLSGNGAVQYSTATYIVCLTSGSIQLAAGALHEGSHVVWVGQFRYLLSLAPSDLQVATNLF